MYVYLSLYLSTPLCSLGDHVTCVSGRDCVQVAVSSTQLRPPTGSLCQGPAFLLLSCCCPLQPPDSGYISSCS